MERPDLPAREAVQLCLNFNVRKAARVLTQHYNSALQASGLLATQFSVLVALSFGGPVTITELADILVTDRTTLARNLRPLKRQKYIHIARGEVDKRRKYVSITALGEQALGGALPLWAQTQEDLKSAVGSETWQRLQADLAALVGTLQE